MLGVVLAHAALPWHGGGHWAVPASDVAVLLGLLLTGGVYARGSARRRRRRRERCFWPVLVVLAIALTSPLDVLASQLASAHMVQHVLLVLVAAPLLAASAPLPTLLAGAPAATRRLHGRGRRLAPAVTGARVLRSPWLPTGAWGLHVGVLWLWHSAVLYDAALRHEPVHLLEHATFLGTALLFWHTILHPSSRRRSVPGADLLLIFLMAMQGVLLSALLTFSSSPWYLAYGDAPLRWGLDPLGDQQLAGVLMWVPAGFIHLAVALVVLMRWLREVDVPAPASTSEVGSPPSGNPAAGAGS